MHGLSYQRFPKQRPGAKQIKCFAPGVFFVNSETPSGELHSAFRLSVKNEGYKYKPLCRLALRRVEQYTRRLRFRLLSTFILNTIIMKTV